ncbi:MAG: type II toxin-antitoxin system RelE/ParE family toxin [Cyanobacteria bacterium J06648_11]
MAEYTLTTEAEDDLREIAAYTDRTWGRAQARRYATQLEAHFEALTTGAAVTRAAPQPLRSAIRVSRCGKHYVFSTREQQQLLIVAVLHENMDLMRRLSERLDEGS